MKIIQHICGTILIGYAKRHIFLDASYIQCNYYDNETDNFYCELRFQKLQFVQIRKHGIISSSSCGEVLSIESFVCLELYTVDAEHVRKPLKQIKKILLSRACPFVWLLLQE